MSDMKPVLVVIVVCSALLSAEEPKSRATVVRATGEASVSVRAEQAHLRLAVVTKAGTAERAREKNAERATTVITRLRELLGQDANVRTANYSLTKDYPDGYVANNTVEVHVNDPAITGKVIDVAARSGANVISGTEAAALDEQNARSEALKEATIRAQTNAEAIARALRMRVVRVVSAETSALPVTEPSVLTRPQVLTKKKRTVETPVASGTMEVRAQVTITIEVAP